MNSEVTEEENTSELIVSDDCIDKANDNVFELVMLIIQRSKDLSSGAEVTSIDKNNDSSKSPVLAMQEISSGKVSIDELRNRYIDSLRKKSIKNQLLSDENIESSDSKLSEVDTLSYVSNDASANEISGVVDVSSYSSEDVDYSIDGFYVEGSDTETENES
jgi:DNA-directed RNA polymerase subunit K/omega